MLLTTRSYANSLKVTPVFQFKILGSLTLADQPYSITKDEENCRLCIQLPTHSSKFYGEEKSLPMFDRDSNSGRNIPHIRSCVSVCDTVHWRAATCFRAHGCRQEAMRSWNGKTSIRKPA